MDANERRDINKSIQGLVPTTHLYTKILAKRKVPSVFSLNFYICYQTNQIKSLRYQLMYLSDAER